MLYQIFCLLLYIFSVAGQNCFDLNTANTSVWLAGNAYCQAESYSSHVFKGASEGFRHMGTFIDQDTDMHGYYGYFSHTKQIWVVYRGTDSLTK